MVEPGHPPGQDDDHDALLDEAIASYLEAAENDVAVDPQAWLERYPAVAPDLAAFFADQRDFDKLAAPLRAVLQASASSANVPCVGSDNRRLHSAPLKDASSRFGHYMLLGALGQGSRSVVYRACDFKLNRFVALKVLSAGSWASSSLIHVREEVQAAAQLDHPRIVPVYEVGICEDRPYISMKLMQGGALADRQRRLAEAPREAARLIASLARTMHDVHGGGILHGHLKPSNLLLDAHGEPHIAGFGLAEQPNEHDRQAPSGPSAWSGKRCFWAPEQLPGSERAVTAATDVYGLGAVLYSSLTGRAPPASPAFEANSSEQDKSPEVLQRLNTRVDRPLWLICLKCLESDPLRRYAGCGELADELEHYLATGTDSRTALVGRLWRWCFSKFTSSRR